MPQIYLCFLWHMHQPFYKDLITGEYKLPWTRLHALKDYYGMVRLLEEFPSVRQTFNLVPSMMVQVAEYAAGEARDPLLECAVKSAEGLTDGERDLILENFFLAHPQHMINRYTRYGELYDARRAQRDLSYARLAFATQEIRDLQVLSQIAWFDEEFLENDAEVRGLVEKGRNFNLDDQALMARKQREILGRVIPAYHQAANSGQIEISTTPYYHPILPLLCDSDVASIAHPGVTLPHKFRYPQDAQRQLEMAHKYIGTEFGVAPLGLWPSEGSVSDEAFRLAAQSGFQWAATDSGVLDRTLGRSSGIDGLYRPYKWSQDGREMRVIFRDHFLSDLIGFVYSRMNPREAAQDFLDRIRENCRGVMAKGRNALVPIILDGENAWEYFDRNGRPFLRELYRRIADDRLMAAVTVSEALARIDPEPIDHIFPGSWINANFDIWIGAEEDNQAWDYLLQARETYDRASDVPEDKKHLALEELLIAEGSDWCWWYGPEHESTNRPDFDRLFRSHLANVYRALGQVPPEELSRSILKVSVPEFHLDPTGLIQPLIDGEVTSYFEWLGAGIYRTDPRFGAMHGSQVLIHEIYYGTDGARFYMRLDFHSRPEEITAAIELRIRFQCVRALVCPPFKVYLEGGKARAALEEAEAVFHQVLEIGVPLHSIAVEPGEPLEFQLSVWQGGLPVAALPQEGWLKLITTKPSDGWT